MGKKGGGRPSSAPPTVAPFVWPEIYRPHSITIEVTGGESLSDAEYEAKRREIPWQFRPPVRHSLTFREEVEPMRDYVLMMLERVDAKLKQKAAEEAAAKAASKKGGGKKGRPQSAKV